MKKLLTWCLFCGKAPGINLKRMKLTVLFSFLVFTVSWANSYSQNTRLSLDLKKVTVQKLIEEIEEQTDFYFLYQDDVFRKGQQITIRVKDETLENIIKEFEEQAGVTAEITEHQIILKKKSSESGTKSEQQKKKVTGVVFDAGGMPLPGVTVLLKGTSTGTVTDADGKFELEIPEGEQTLVFSFVGMQNKEVPTIGTSTFNVVLEQDDIGVEEVVVIGYGTQKKHDLTTSIVSVDSEELQKISSPTFAHSLQGKAAGVLVNTESGQPGGNTSIRIRGFGSMNFNEPLYVIDGVILNNYADRWESPTLVTGGAPETDILSSLNPNDIESINILKDASATAIYGSRAGNGVVLITTKKGAQGKARINFDTYYGFQEVANKIDVMTGPEYAKFSNEGRLAAGMVPYTGYANPAELPTTNWQDALFRTAPIQNYQLSASGGNGKNNFYTSIGYFDQEGIIPNSWFERYSIRLNSDHQLTDRVKIGNTFSISQSKSNALPNGNLTGGVVLGALMMPPYIPVYSETEAGRIYHGVGDYEALFAGRISNPYHSAIRSYNFSDVKKMLGNLYVELEIFNGLKLKTDLGLDYTFSANRSFQRTYVDYPLNPGENPVSQRDVPQASSRSYAESNVSLDVTLTYNRAFNKHSITALIGHTAQEFKTDVTNTSSIGHLTDVLITTAAGDPTTFRGSNGLNELAYESYIGRAMYNYDSKYYLTYSFRRDGSSRFGSGLKFADFHSISGAWRISSEEFMIPVKNVISDLKLRGSWGQTGIDGSLPPVEYPRLQDHYTYVFNGDQFATGYAPVDVPNPRLRWETAEQVDFGMDAMFFDGKIQFTADYYIKKQYDIITQKPIPFLLGMVHEFYSPAFPTATVNGPEVLNKGYELTLDYNSEIQSFAYTIGANFSSYTNEITKLDSDWIGDHSYNGYNIILNRQGYPINQFYGFVTDGIITDPNDPALDRQSGSALGDVRYKNIEQDDVINDEDRAFIGSPIPDFTFGLNLGFKWLGFDFSASLQGVYGNKIYNANMGRLLDSKDGGNRHVFMNDRWSPENPDGEYPRAITTDPNNNFRASDLFIEDGSYLRLQNVELGYTFSSGILNRLHLSRLRIYTSLQNGFTLTNYSGYSPEVGVESIDASVYPVARKLLFGLNLGF